MKTKQLLVTLFFSLGVLSGASANIEPSQAFSEALKVAELDVREAYGLGKDFRIFEVGNIGIGKYDPGRFGDYTVAFSLFNQSDTTDVRSCSAHFSILKVPFAKQPGDVHILEEVINDYQIIAKRNDFTCE